MAAYEGKIQVGFVTVYVCAGSQRCPPPAFYSSGFVGMDVQTDYGGGERSRFTGVESLQKPTASDDSSGNRVSKLCPLFATTNIVGFCLRFCPSYSPRPRKTVKYVLDSDRPRVRARVFVLVVCLKQLRGKSYPEYLHPVPQCNSTSSRSRVSHR